MRNTGQMIPLTDFGAAMRARADDSFAARVEGYASRFGEPDRETLAVLAQAAYYCWGNCHFRENLLQVCAAIGSGRPTCMYLHSQVSPPRWAELNSYVVGVQVWLNPGDARVPDGVDRELVAAIAGWLGEHSTTTRTLSDLFLNELVPDLLSMNLSKLGGDEHRDCEEYRDFARWYMRPDGSRFGDGRQVFADRRLRELADEVACHSTLTPMIANLTEAQPRFCMHRSARHLDIQLASIGALDWRGNLPRSGALSRESWIHFIEVDCGVRSWLADDDPPGDFAATVHAALGPPTDWKRAVVGEFLCEQDRGSPFSGSWIDEQSRAGGRTAQQLFGRGRARIAGRSGGSVD